ncbi:hypothetical protein RSSM_01144 [Rhodopirellula sallentina SM41]|uniref:Uncharacterized protein n=1 Tax=Rhodopirellula sallentina SM41 TaxID=1263870 RepID=M5U7I3_9BACT|nr:hypothetical protein RSSM_01144 [Rhodopirellula sallentina SM41]
MSGLVSGILWGKTGSSPMHAEVRIAKEIPRVNAWHKYFIDVGLDSD